MKVDGLPDALGRRIESRFAELPVIAETARKTFLVVQSGFQDTPTLPDQLSIEVRRVVLDTVQRAIFEAAGNPITVSDIEATMRRVLLEHDLHISRNGSSRSGEKLVNSESLLELEPSQRGIRRRRASKLSQNARKDAKEPARTSQDQGTEQDTKKTSGHPSFVVRIFRSLNRRTLYLALQIALDTAFPVLTILIRILPRFPHAKLRTILAARYEALFVAPANENRQVVQPQQQLYVNIVFRSSRHMFKLFSLNVTHMQCDMEFFLALKRFYEERRDGKYSWRKYLSLQDVVKIRLVCFQMYSPSGFVDVIRTDSIPPPHDSAYRCSRSPMEDFLPIPNILLMHYFLYPLHTLDSKMCLERIPKCTLHLDTLLGQVNHHPRIGWGLQIVETWSGRKMIVSAFSLLSTSAGLVSVLATLYNHDLRESLWYGSYVMAFAILGAAVVQLVLLGV